MSNTLVRQHAARQRRHHLEHRVVRETTRLVSARTAAWLLRDVLRQAIDIPDFGRALPMPEECIIALTTLRAWQYRVWITLGKPSGPFILDHIPSAPPKRRVSRPRKLKPDGSFYKARPPVIKDPLNWALGRSYAAAVVQHLRNRVSTIEWHAYELRHIVGPDYARIGQQLKLSASDAQCHYQRVRDLHEQWLSIPKYCTHLAKTRGTNAT